MKRPIKPRPNWVVLAPKRKTLKEDVLRVYGDYPEPCPWEIRQGKANHAAIIEYRPGHHDTEEDPLAKVLSRGAKKSAYVLLLHDDAPRVKVFSKGKHVGDVAEWPDEVARQLGCTFPQRMPGRGKVDLTPRKEPKARLGEFKVIGCTIAQWKHLMRYAADWSALLDAASESDAREALDALDALDHKDADVRAVACELVEVIGIYGYGTKAPDALARLRALATLGPHQEGPRRGTGVGLQARRGDRDPTDPRRVSLDQQLRRQGTTSRALCARRSP
jgi:hypothetical protein